MRRTRRWWLSILAVVLTLWGGLPAARAEDCATALIAEVNALRAQRGMAPYRVDPILMAVAQAHSDYQASIGKGTHYSADGSRPRDRVIAAGYGRGAAVFVSENIAWGINLSPAQAVQMWTEDAPHLNTMLGPNYRDVGAGCATGSDGRTYYTLDAAYTIGGAAPPPGPTPTPDWSQLPVAPVIVATPRADGAVVHIVRFGQTLGQIAWAYGVPLEQILQLNGMTEHTIIYPGDEILIRPPFTPTPTTTPTRTPTPQPSPTPTVPPPTPSLTPSPTVTPSPTPRPPVRMGPGGAMLLWGILGGLLLAGGGYAALRWLVHWEGEG